MTRVLVLRSGGAGAPEPDTLVTHEILAREGGLAEVRSFDPKGAWLIVTSKTTVELLVVSGLATLFSSPFALRTAAGEETAKAMKEAGAPQVLVPPLPGAAGIVQALSTLSGKRRILWPRGSDADAAPFAPLLRRGGSLAAPVIYEKKPAARLDPELLFAFRSGAFGGVAVSSLAALEVFLAAVGTPGPEALTKVKWGVLGPETARLLAERGFPAPLVPERARLSDLITLLKES